MSEAMLLLVRYSEAQLAGERRGKNRVSVSLPIGVFGIDEQSNHFVEVTSSMDISSSGVSFLLKRKDQHQLKLGTLVKALAPAV